MLWLFHISSHTVPQIPLWNTSSLPSYIEEPPTSRTTSTKVSELTTLCGKLHLSKKNAHLVASEIIPPTLIILIHPILAYLRMSEIAFSSFSSRQQRKRHFQAPGDNFSPDTYKLIWYCLYHLCRS